MTTTSVWLFIGLAKKFLQGPNTQDFPCDSAGKESACSTGDWVGKIPWRKERLPPPVFWPGEIHGLYSPWGCKESDTTE